jgi:hypothetical protein
MVSVSAAQPNFNEKTAAAIQPRKLLLNSSADSDLPLQASAPSMSVETACSAFAIVFKKTGYNPQKITPAAGRRVRQASLK